MADSSRFDNDESLFELRPDNSFCANSKGIIEKKAEFFDEAEEFLYLRKGEDVGADIIAVLAMVYQQMYDDSFWSFVGKTSAISAIIERIIKFYRWIREKIEERKEALRNNLDVHKPVSDVRIICWPDTDNKKVKPLFRKLNYRVHRYESESQKGALRYYLNEKRFCLFIRTGDDDFTGVIGNDSRTIAELKQAFEKEWASSIDFDETKD